MTGSNFYFFFFFFYFFLSKSVLAFIKKNLINWSVLSHVKMMEVTIWSPVSSNKK